MDKTERLAEISHEQPWHRIERRCGKALKRLSVPGMTKEGQSIRAEFADGTAVEVFGSNPENAWRLFWRAAVAD